MKTDDSSEESGSLLLPSHAFQGWNQLAKFVQWASWPSESFHGSLSILMSESQVPQVIQPQTHHIAENGLELLPPSTSQVLELEAWATNSANRLRQIWGCFPPPRPSLMQTSQCYFVNSLTVSVFLQMRVSSCGKWILRTPVNKHLFPRMMVLEFSSGLNSQYDLLAGRLPTLQLSGPARICTCFQRVNEPRNSQLARKGPQTDWKVFSLSCHLDWQRLHSLQLHCWDETENGEISGSLRQWAVLLWAICTW